MLHNQPCHPSRVTKSEILPLVEGYGIAPAKWNFSEILHGLKAFIRFIEKYDDPNHFSLFSSETLREFLYTFPHLLCDLDDEVTPAQYKTLNDMISEVAEKRLRRVVPLLKEQENYHQISKLLEPEKLEELKDPQKRVELLATYEIGSKMGLYYQGKGPFLFVDLRRNYFEVKHRIYLNPPPGALAEIIRNLIRGCAKSNLEEVYFKFIDYTNFYKKQGVVANIDLVRGDKIVVYCGNDLQGLLNVVSEICRANPEAFAGRQTVPFTGKIVCKLNDKEHYVLDGIGYAEEIRSKPGVPEAFSFTERRAQFLSQVLRCIALKSTARQLPSEFYAEEVLPNQGVTQKHGASMEVFAALVTKKPNLLVDLEPHDLAIIAKNHDINPDNLCCNYPDPEPQ